MRIGITSVVLAIGVLPAFAQEHPKPAPVLQIFREAIKEGRAAAHEKVEAEYAAAFRKANFPGHYIALSALSGTGEVWFVQPAASFSVTEEWMKAEDKEPLKSAVAMLDARDGELRSGSRGMWAVYRPDLSYAVDKFSPYTARFFTVATYRIKLGQDEAFANAAKTLFAAYEKGNIDECIVGYQVVAGAPSGTFLFFVGMNSLQFMDGSSARSKALTEAMGQENFSQFMKGSGDMFASIESALFQVKPGMSYPNQMAIDTDPAFWKPKPAMKPAAAPAHAEKKSGN